ncbi:BZ3500_MvSof-1268-A1-R1_Chr10-1g02619 [Microbotryum saponariae]|uniref:BZ3500_MvSof-1268-A1-R1_Chr10-1g02619 protein n=1 Tax=Microbotryum saponariae TaxID=289078 RepID=A0A2X0LLQ3_9BASI|nr:BZ3500_MvSof-1268-A1-R1_Chr10-1g02619 [Microbotryum saponariae]SDA06108.1 BZ3501_MvSof-1269-A2-R1_Chr10-1g02220 [Microbotryum saponariae]
MHPQRPTMSTHASAHPHPQSWTKTIIKGRNKACSRCHIRRVRCTGTEGEPCYACLRTAKARNHDLEQVYCGYRSASCSEEIFDHINRKSQPHSPSRTWLVCGGRAAPRTRKGVCAGGASARHPFQQGGAAQVATRESRRAGWGAY